MLSVLHFASLVMFLQGRGDHNISHLSLAHQLILLVKRKWKGYADGCRHDDEFTAPEKRETAVVECVAEDAGQHGGEGVPHDDVVADHG